MARQLQALGRALYGVTSLAPGRAAGAAALSGFGGLRAFGTTVGDLPAKGAPPVHLAPPNDRQP